MFELQLTGQQWYGRGNSKSLVNWWTAQASQDKAVDKCYRAQPFESDAKRVEFLFGLYERYAAGLLAQEKEKKVKKERK